MSPISKKRNVEWLTWRSRRRSVRKIALNDAMRIRNTTWLANACSLVTMLALVVGPVCAPLCATRICPQASASTVKEAPCHFAGAMHREGPQIHTLRNCGAFELPPAVLNSSTENDELPASGVTASAEGFGAWSQELSPTLLKDSEHCSAGPPLMSFSSVSPSNGVLRI